MTTTDRSPLRVAVIGDIHGEVVASLPELRYAELTADTLCRVPIAMGAGGTAVNFACAAAERFTEVHLIGRVGIDRTALIATGGLDEAGVICHLVQDPGRPTGLAVVLRDADPARPKGTRLLLVQRDSANRGLTTAEVEAHRSLLMNVDALVVDGYAMLAEPRRSACLHAMEIVATAGGVVVFDVVPHDSYRRYDLVELNRLCLDAAVLVAEVGTLCGFLGYEPHPDGFDRAQVEAVLPSLCEAFPGRALFLRFGIGNADESLCVLPGRPPRYRRTGYVQTREPTGFGDRLTADELAEFLPVLSGRTSVSSREGEAG